MFCNDSIALKLLIVLIINYNWKNNKFNKLKQRTKLGLNDQVIRNHKRELKMKKKNSIPYVTNGKIAF